MMKGVTKVELKGKQYNYMISLFVNSHLSNFSAIWRNLTYA
jgi:hypothetical protein